LRGLTPEQQAETFKNCFRKDWQDKESHLLPAKHLAVWIDANLYLALAEATFPTDYPALNEEAEACLTCPRRTGFNTQLFADVEADHCLDAACYRSKVAAFIAREVAANPELVQISTEWRPANDRSADQLLPNEYRRVQPPRKAAARPQSRCALTSQPLSSRTETASENACPSAPPWTARTPS
jgi:ParB family chromosome partitioning protein